MTNSGKAIVLTDGKAGHENQSKAFARALGLDFQLVPVKFKSPFHKMLSYLFDRLGIRILTQRRRDAEKKGRESLPNQVRSL